MLAGGCCCRCGLLGPQFHALTESVGRHWAREAEGQHSSLDHRCRGQGPTPELSSFATVASASWMIYVPKADLQICVVRYWACEAKGQHGSLGH